MVLGDWLVRLTTDSILARVVNGYRALTYQNYIEVNVKTGRQRVVQYEGSVAAGASYYFGVVTGDEPLVIKSRLINQIGSTEVQYSAYEDRTFTGGSDITPRNPNRITQITPSATFKHGVTPDAGGVLYLEPYPIFASGNNAASRIGADALGLEYILKPNTSHVFVIANPGTGTAKFHWWITYYEGTVDLPSGELS